MANYYGDDTENLQSNAFVNYYGGDGADLLKGTAGANSLYGGDDNDVLGGSVAVFNTDTTGTGDSASDPITYKGTAPPSGNDILEGGSGIDSVHGFDGDDVIDGGQGDDGGVMQGYGSFYYEAGLFGGDGNDVIYGGGGDDEIHGGLGQDDLYGGEDSDTFIFASLEEVGKGSTSDYIGDFRSKQGDLIDLSAIDANDIKGGDQKFKWIGDDSFSKAGQISFKNGKVKINTDDDKGAEAVLIVNTNKMAADDFIL